MNSPILQSKYPIVGTNHFVKISIGVPELDPKSKYKDYRCQFKISAPDYEKNFMCMGLMKFNVFGSD